MEVGFASIANRSFNPKPKVKVSKEHPRYPWEPVDDGPKRIGDRGERTSEEVIAFLQSL